MRDTDTRPHVETLADRFLTTGTVDDVVSQGARRWPERTAMIFGDRRWTYAELDAAVSRGAAFLLSRGLSKGDRVATYGRNSDAYAIAYLSCARAGLVHVPVNYALVGDELSYIVTQSGARMVLTDPSLLAVLSTVELAEVDTGTLLHGGPDSFIAAVATGPVPDIDCGPAETDVVQLLYTSGTTSLPKGAIMTHRALMFEYLSAAEALECSEVDRPLHPMPLYHSAGMHVFLLPYLMVGATNTILEAPVIEDVLDTLEREQNGAVFLAPTVWVSVAQRPDLATRSLRALRKAFYGSSIMPATTLSALQEALPNVGFYNCFGQSEIGPLSTVLRPIEHEKRPASCGRAVRFVNMRVVDSDGVDVPAGQPGEIVYRSPQLCLGYWGNAAATEEAFRDGWFRSGDLAEMDEEGYITILDRIKDIINTGGVNVAPRHVEDVLYQHSAVAEVAVVGLPDPKWIEAVTAFVVACRPVDAAELVSFVSGKLSPQAAPKRYVFVEELPKNQSGKLLKRELRELVD